MRPHLELGRAGEASAAAFYRRRGYRIVERNYRCRSGEIDLIESAAAACWSSARSRPGHRRGGGCLRRRSGR